MSQPSLSDPVRTLYAIDNLQFGGGERVFSQIINGLNPDRYKPFIVSGSNEQFLNAIQNSGVKHVALDFSKQFNPLLFFKIADIIRQHQIQIVHGQGSRAEFYARYAKGIAGNCKYVSTIAMPVEGFDIGSVRKKHVSFFR